MSVSLKPIGEIFTETWHLYKQRSLPILAVILLTTLSVVAIIFGLILLGALMAGGFQELTGRFEGGSLDPALLLYACVASLIIMVVVVWSQAAAIAVSADEDMSIIGALRAGWQYFVPFVWISTLYMGIVMTGFALLIIPGLFLGLSMSLCYYTMFVEDLRGMDAVLASHSYVRGRWWNTFGKFTAVGLLSMLVGSVPFIGQVLSFLFTPYLLLFMVVVYRDLKETAGEVDLEGEKRWWWNIMAAMGIILPTLALIGVLVTLAPRFPELIEQMENGGLPELELPQSGTGSEEDLQLPPQAAPEARQLDSADGTLVWRDPVGDAGDSPLDIRQVAVESGRNEMKLTILFAKPLTEYCSSGITGELTPAATFYFDTDVDRMTGDAARGGAGRAGYELMLDVVFEHLLENGIQVHASLYALDAGSRRSKGMLAEEDVILSGNTLELIVPYTLLGVRSGQTVRLCFREPAQQQGGGLSKDKLIPLE
jgi:hypothetical protein